MAPRLRGARLDEIRTKRHRLTEGLEACGPAAVTAREARTEEEVLRAFCEDVRLGLECATLDERQRALRVLAHSIEVESDGDRGTPHGAILIPSEDTRLRPRRCRGEPDTMVGLTMLSVYAARDARCGAQSL